MRCSNAAKCLLTITLAVLITAAIAVGCASAQTEGDKNVAESSGVSDEGDLRLPNGTEIPTEYPGGDPTDTPFVEDTEVPAVKITEEPVFTSDGENLDAPSDSAAPTLEPLPPPLAMTEMQYVSGYVNEDFVNLRAEPSTDSDIVKVFTLGTQLYVTARNNEWFRVEIGSYKGYMARAYVKLGKYEPETPKPTATPKPSTTPKPTTPAMYTVHEGQFSEYEIRLVAALIHSEGPGSSKVGYRALASIVLNRVLNESRWFPDDVEGVIFQPGQFGYSRSYLESVTPNSKAMAAARYVFSSHGATLPKKVLFYRASYLGYEWASYTRFYATIEGNNYYYGIHYY